MRNDDGMTPAERELEATLSSLTPVRPNADRDRVMFTAGRASMRMRKRLWQGVSSTLAVLLLVSTVFRSRPTSPAQAPATIARDAPRPALPSAELIDLQRAEAFRQYVRTRRAVLDRGVEAIPTSAEYRGTRSDPPLTREDLDDLLSST